MTLPALLALDALTFLLPDGSPLFEDLTERLDARPTGLVGRNGVGKSVLARLLAGQLPPSRGRIDRWTTVRYLPQTLDPGHLPSVAHLAGFGAVFEALRRLQDGSLHQADFDLLDGRWDLPERLQAALDEAGLGHVRSDTPSAHLSGGQRMAVALAGLFLDGPAFLLLDEPTNHLDAEARQVLQRRLADWRHGALVISHDRALLDTLPCTLALGPGGLRRYGGGHAFYERSRQREAQAAEAELHHARLARSRGERQLRQQRERQAQRSAHGQQRARDGNQAKILLDAQKERSQGSAARLDTRQAQALEQLDQAVREAARRVAPALPVHLYAEADRVAPGQGVLHVEGLRMPHSLPGFAPLDLHLAGPCRLVVSGPNGCGKSTLLQVLAGHLAPDSGDCRRPLPLAYMDQHGTRLDPQRSALEQLREANPALDEGTARTRLVHAGLVGDRALLPCGDLSGGERLKVALACVLDARPAARLLMLDEPQNHIDLDSLRELEAVLAGFPGALIVVAHDERFLAALAPTERLRWTPAGWRHESWRPGLD
ncbi:ABC-F family ATP-binding cassette domain-containing protein [Pseudomonas mangiferae]|uniref:ABC-F family ATP-binding cassette domain-containing protein n=1 Tax=Pseudomonas mangiferae TaxID=2593654 RepID=A0A553GYB9_9PSED|nr:ABC-F family ATP-binding cassette domain-containing protein [Pseudomonas mangiferae]TRX74496.1 ABC-F family ATP-binding cassette domain-containing protein [Pseudomonas mangiferae]